MRLSIAAVTAAVAATGVAACAPPPPDGPTGPQRHKVEVTQDIDSITVPFRANSAELPDGSRCGLAGFLDEIGAGRDAVVVVRAPTGLRGDLGVRRRHAVARFLKRQGFRPVQEDALMPEVSIPEKEVLVRVARYTAELPDCPDHSRRRLGSVLNQNSSNYGCGRICTRICIDQ